MKLLWFIAVVVVAVVVTPNPKIFPCVTHLGSVGKRISSISIWVTSESPLSFHKVSFRDLSFFLDRENWSLNKAVVEISLSWYEVVWLSMFISYRSDPSFIDGIGRIDSHSFVDRCNVLIRKGEKKRFRKGYREISLLFVGPVKNNGQCACHLFVGREVWPCNAQEDEGDEGSMEKRGVPLFSFFLCPGDKERKSRLLFLLFYFDPPAHHWFITSWYSCSFISFFGQSWTL